MRRDETGTETETGTGTGAESQSESEPASDEEEDDEDDEDDEVVIARAQKAVGAKRATPETETEPEPEPKKKKGKGHTTNRQRNPNNPQSEHVGVSWHAQAKKWRGTALNKLEKTASGKKKYEYTALFPLNQLEACAQATEALRARLDCEYWAEICLLYTSPSPRD